MKRETSDEKSERKSDKRSEKSHGRRNKEKRGYLKVSSEDENRSLSDSTLFGKGNVNLPNLLVLSDWKGL